MAQGKLGLPRFWAIGLLGPWIASFTALIFAAVTGVPGFNAGILNLGAGLLVLGFLFGLLPASIWQ